MIDPAAPPGANIPTDPTDTGNRQSRRLLGAVAVLMVAFAVSALMVIRSHSQQQWAHTQAVSTERLLSQLSLQNRLKTQMVEMVVWSRHEQYRETYDTMTEAFLGSLGKLNQGLEAGELQSLVTGLMETEIKLRLRQTDIMDLALSRQSEIARARLSEAAYRALRQQAKDTFDLLHWELIDLSLRNYRQAYQTLLIWTVLAFALGLAIVAVVLTLHRRSTRQTFALAQAHADLQQVRADLEVRVEDRTRELQVALTQARASDEAKSAFLANMSHEVRTPLNGILGFASLMQAEPGLSGGNQERLELILSSGRALQALLDDVLDLSRIESGRLTLENKPFDLTVLLEDLASRMRMKASAKGLDLLLEFGFDVPDRVVGDAKRLNQVLSNLLSNAIKFTTSGDIRLSVEVVEDSLGAEEIAFTVIDTGCGFDMAEKDRLFRRFERSDEALTNTVAGSGLGLPISLDLATLMGGSLDCQSEKGKGSTFTLQVPLPEVTPCAATGADSAAGATHTPRDWQPHPIYIRGRPVRVLVAEDNQSNVLLIQAALALIAAQVDVVGNGVDAVNAWAPDSHDLILMDMQMPVMDGLEATRQIRAREAELGLQRMPILCLTANILPRHRREALAAGCDSHIPKPILPRDLCNTIEQALESRGLVDAPLDREDELLLLSTQS